MTTDTPTRTALIGTATSRVEGPLKVSGAAQYTSDHHFDGMLVGVPVTATIASGRVRQIDSRIAQAMPGVHTIFTTENIGPLYRVSPSSGASIDEYRPPLSDDKVTYYGQYVALVVADTFDNATAAARAVKVSYDAEQPDVSLELTPDDEPSVDTERGDPDAAFAKGEVTLDAVYTTPPETHNPIELHSSVAVFDGTRYTLYETSQAIMNHQAVMVQMLGVKPENVRVVTEYLGSGFGGKLWPWTHSVLAAAAARQLRRPIKIEITRKMMFQTVGHRTNTQQRMRLSATKDGKLTSLQQDYVFHVSRLDKSKENCGEATGYFYSVPNLRATAAFARRDIAPNTSMRGPGAVPGLYALESAMDEMAIKLNLDPVQFRLLNEPEIDESLGVPFSTRHYTDCLTHGAKTFGWHERTPEVGSMRRDGMIVGWGMAGASWMAKRLAAESTVTFLDDGRVRIACGTQDIGTGTYTVLAQMVADMTGMDIGAIHVQIGDSALPAGPMSGGSMATGSLVPSVSKSAKAAIDNLLGLASQGEHSPLSGVDKDDLAFTGGWVHRKDQAADQGLRFKDLLAKENVAFVSGDGSSEPSSKDEDDDKRSMHSYGAHFVEVTWQPEIARLRVNRVLTVIDAGKIINPRTGRNQIEGAVIMGVGMALFEQTHYDRRNGAPINSNLADYVMTTHADAPTVDVEFLDFPDLALNEIGARGIGEIGLAGFAAAVTAAVYHATGVRVRDLPVKIEDLLASTITT
ncbi:xanthine dehydrogenase family protein molybdopterin-binding subunit [Pigmentiphaga litoralis]|uniref:xanthine dehydrogenase family protein molybdopterin-binding subunit n=1 Tax=Pigmentiphaga litoralis TaxID=516702 RepID=UPI003B42A7BE